MRIIKLLSALVGLVVLLVACGKDRSGGDSETHWMKQCTIDSDCDGGATCSCGVCTKACDSESDCSSLGTNTTCASSGEIASCSTTSAPSRICLASCSGPAGCPSGFECSANGCTPVPSGASGGEGAGGAGGGPQGSSGNGGAICKPDRGGIGGAVAIPGRPPGNGRTCPKELEGFEVCSPTSEPDVNVLSRCVEEKWVTVEPMSDCSPSLASTGRCAEPGAAENVCCDGVRYCILIGLCDGTRWWTDGVSVCGDGLTQGNETCDDGNLDPSDDCLDSCKGSRCGDGVRQVTGSRVEECDDGAGNGPEPARCSASCTLN